MAVTKYDPSTTISLKVAPGVIIAEGKLVGMNNGMAVLAANNGKQAVGVAVRGGNGDKGDYIAVAPVAIVDNLSGLTQGATVYLGAGGDPTSTRPTAAGAIIQGVGTAVSATKALYNVSPSVAVAQASGSTTLG